MNSRLILMLCADFIIILLLALIPLRKKLLLKKLGEPKQSLSTIGLYGKKNTLAGGSLVILVSFVLCAVILIRDFGLLMNVVLELCGILCSYITSKTFIVNGLSAVYENGIAACDKVVMFKDVAKAPELLEGEDGRFSVAVFTSKEPAYFTFSEREQAQTLLECIKKAVQKA